MRKIQGLPVPETPDELRLAQRRIEQLEAALARRTELLEQRTAELGNIRAGKVFRFANGVQKLVNRFFPIHTRRRAFLRNGSKKLFGTVGWLLGKRAARNGPPPEARHLTEAAPPDEYRRWIQREEPSAADMTKQRSEKFANAPTISIAVPVFNPPIAFLKR